MKWWRGKSNYFQNNTKTYNNNNSYNNNDIVNIMILKGLGNIVQMRESGAKLLTLIIDVQLKIIWTFEWRRTKLIWSIT